MDLHTSILYDAVCMTVVNGCAFALWMLQWGFMRYRWNAATSMKELPHTKRLCSRGHGFGYPKELDEHQNRGISGVMFIHSVINFAQWYYDIFYRYILFTSIYIYTYYLLYIINYIKGIVLVLPFKSRGLDFLAGNHIGTKDVHGSKLITM